MLGAKLPQPQENIEFGLRAGSVKRDYYKQTKSTIESNLSNFSYNPKETRVAKKVAQPFISQN